jgi:hypothetical protein
MMDDLEPPGIDAADTIDMRPLERRRNEDRLP